MQSIISKTIANKMRKTPNMIDQRPPKRAETVDVANVKTAKANKNNTASTNVKIGTSLGMQWVRVILKSPIPKAIINV
jgi:hypothetical protein